MSNQVTEIDEQLLSLWEGMKPREASALKFIVMNEEGFFAGQFTCDVDSHGDRYFVIQQAPRTKKWSLASNLASNLEDNSISLPKTSIKLREEYKEIIERAIYRLEPKQNGRSFARDQLSQARQANGINADDASDISELFRQPTPTIEAIRYNPEDVSEVVDFPPGKYFVGDPCYAIPDERWEEFLEGIEGEAIDLEGIGRSVFYSHQYETDDEGMSYPTDSGLIGVVCINNLGIDDWKRLKTLGRLVEFTEGEEIARDEEGEELYAEWESAFQTYNDNNGNIFLGWNWFYSDPSAAAPVESGFSGTSENTNTLEFAINNDALVNTSESLIYMWEIKEAGNGSVIGRYIGKSSKGASRPLTHYARNVANLLAGKPYRKENPNGFRRIHHALADAVKQGARVELHFLANVGSLDDINETERQYIKQLDSAGKESWQLNDKRAE